MFRGRQICRADLAVVAKAVLVKEPGVQVAKEALALVVLGLVLIIQVSLLRNTCACSFNKFKWLYRVDI